MPVYAGRIVVSTSARRIAMGANDDIIALTASCSASPIVSPWAFATATNSLDGRTLLIRRLSVLSPTLNPARRNGPIGWSATLGTAPICTLQVGAISRWI